MLTIPFMIVFSLWASLQAAQVDRLALIRAALDESHITLKELCWYWANPKTGKECDKGLAHRKLHGQAKLSWDDLCLLPVKFWQNLAWLTLQEVGMPREMRRAAVFALALHGQKHVAVAARRERRVS